MTDEEPATKVVEGTFRVISLTPRKGGGYITYYDSGELTYTKRVKK